MVVMWSDECQVNIRWMLVESQISVLAWHWWTRNLTIATTYSNDDTTGTGSFVYYCSMICGTNVLSPKALSSLSCVIAVILTRLLSNRNRRICILTLTQRGAAIFLKSANIFRVTSHQTLARPRPGLPNGLSWCRPGGARLERWTFRGGWELCWECIEDCQITIRPRVFIATSYQSQQWKLYRDSWTPWRKAR